MPRFVHAQLTVNCTHICLLLDVIMLNLEHTSFMATGQAIYLYEHDYSPENLYTAWYLLNDSISYSSLHLMPNRSENLSQFFCGSTRKDIIYGECETGYSAYYHSMYLNYVVRVSDVSTAYCFTFSLKLFQ